MQVDHQVTERLMFRLGYEERHSHRDFLIQPASQQNELRLLNEGRSFYREFQALARFRFQEGRNIFVSYVRSQARGDLNDFANGFTYDFEQSNSGRTNMGQPRCAESLFWGDLLCRHR
jgi:hypothetical protein